MPNQTQPMRTLILRHKLPQIRHNFLVDKQIHSVHESGNTKHPRVKLVRLSLSAIDTRIEPLSCIEKQNGQTISHARSQV